jgi:glycosidase
MRFTSIFKVVAVAALSFVAVACASNQGEAKFALGDNAPVVPMGVMMGETTHYLTDYYPQWVGAENVTTTDERLALENLSGDWSEFAIKTDAETLVSTVEVYHDGNPLSIVVLGGKRDTEGSYMSTIGVEDGRVLVVASQPVKEAVAVWQNNVIEDVLVDDSSITVTIPAEAKNFDRSVVRIFAASEAGRFNDILLPLERGVVVTNAEDIRRTDHQSQILYSLMIDRFNNGNTANDWKINSPEVLDKVDYQGGDLAGITAKINDGFFQDLGVTTIWISPITQNPYDAWGQNVNPDTKFSGYHGYWPIYSTVVDKRFGTEDELREMLSTAHGNEMNVILDYVANHLHINSPVLQEHPDWTTDLILPDGRENIALWDEQRLTTWFDKHIPTLDLEREEVCEPMTDSALHWVKNFEFDGYRHDACKHIPLNYWRMLTHKMKSAMPERNMWQIGETYGSVELIGSYVKSGMIDSQFDFNLYHNSRDVIVDEGRSMRLIAATVEESEAAYGSHHTMGNITGNHDKPRFISLAGGDMPLWGIDDKAEGWHREVVVGDMDKGHAGLQLLKAIITTVPGVPCIYQGDEFGVPGANDPDNRDMMTFEGYNDYQMKEYAQTQALLKYRRSSMPMMYGDFRTLYVDDEAWVFLRHYMGDWAVVAMNVRGAEKSIEVELPDFVECEAVKVAIATEGANAQLTERGTIEIAVPAYGYVIANK